MDKIYNDTYLGCIDCFCEISTYKRDSIISVHPDPNMRGVWMIIHSAGRSILYMAGYKDQFDQIRTHNDFEDIE